MATQIDDKTIVDIELGPVTDGLIDERVLSFYKAPKTSLAYIENLNNDTSGLLTSRSPFFKNSFSPASTINAIIGFTSSGGSIYTVYQEGTSLKYFDTTQFWSSPTIVSIGSLTGTGFLDTHIDNIQGYMIVANRGQVMKYADVSGTYTNLGTSFPNTCDIVSSGFTGRLWAADSTDAECKLYYSDVIPSAGIGSLTGGSNYLRMNSNAGDRITGIARTQNTMFVFTTNQIFRVFNSTSQDNSPISEVGAVNKKCIVKAKDGYYFLHSSGIYTLSDGGAKEISQVIRPFIERIRNDKLQKAVGWSDNDHVYFSVGSEIDGLPNDRSYQLRYTISTGLWSIMSTFGFTATSAVSFTPGYNTATLSTRDYFPTVFVAGTNLSDTSPSINVIDTFTYSKENSEVGGDFAVASSPTIDSGVPLFIKYITQWMPLGDTHKTKEISGISIPAIGAGGINLYYQTDKMKKNVWESVGSISGDWITEWRNVKIQDFKKVRFMIDGTTSGAKVVIGMPILHKVTDKGYGK